MPGVDAQAGASYVAAAHGLTHRGGNDFPLRVCLKFNYTHDVHQNPEVNEHARFLADATNMIRRCSENDPWRGTIRAVRTARVSGIFRYTRLTQDTGGNLSGWRGH